MKLGTMRSTLTALTALVALGSVPAAAEDTARAEVAALTAPSSADTDPAALAGTPLAPLAAFLGDWEVNAKWGDGTPLWARNEFRIGLGGKFIVGRTFAKDGDGEPYERYNTYFAYDPKKKIWSTYGFTNDGSVSVVEEIEVGDEPGRESFTSSWSSNGQTIKQTIQMATKDSYNWKVWMRPDGGGEWIQVMDGMWKRAD